MPIFVGDTYFSAIRWPFHIFNGGYLSVIDHFLNPLVIVLHKHNNFACRIAGCQLSVLIVPADQIDITWMGLDVDALGTGLTLLFIAIGVEFEQFEEAVTGSNCQPAFIRIPSTRICSRLCRDCDFLLQKGKHCLKRYSNYLNLWTNLFCYEWY